MNTRSFLIGMVAIAAVMLSTSCEDALLDQTDKNYGILPEHFKVDVPTSMSNNLKSTSLKSTAIDTISGNHIYWYLNAWIAVGEGAADIVEAAMWSISAFHIENVISLSYTSEDDDRVKNLDVISDVEFRGRRWEYQLTITDAESEGNADGGIGMQVFWNKSPIEGIAIFKPYNLDRNKNVYASNAMGSIEYYENGMNGYDACMIVEMAGLPVKTSQTYAVETMRMFVGKKGHVIDVIGNSNHPNALFNIYDTDNKGFNWAFVASGNENTDVAVAEVGLPRNSADINERAALLEENSIKNVLTRELTNFVVTAYANAGITLRPDEIAGFISPYLKNADAPGYFNSNGFVKGGTAPDGNYSELETRVETLVPYNPVEIVDLKIDFSY
ncbi:MAG: hypothetical protein JW830_12105 [Bacteroidales bacterium]|nr:hypothetical protein [Bacteroidales bacterium]